MSKFVIECPNCGKYAEAKTGFFSRRKIDCTCGYIIDVKIDRFTSRECPHCGNIVLFDQKKGSKAKCPVCKEPINTIDEQSNTQEFSCGQCGVRLRTSKGADKYVCPVCDFVNDVQERITTEDIRTDGLASIIKYEGDNETFIWKHPIEDFNFGSQLIVHESQEAIFFKDGQALDLFGAGRYTLETQQLPLIEKLYQLPTDTEGTFHSEVYFINLSTQMGIKWGTDSKVRLFDPMSGLHIEIGASGEFNIKVVDSRRLLLKVVGTTNLFNQGHLLGTDKGFFKAMVMTQVKSFLAQTIRENAINILEIDEHLLSLSNALREKINDSLKEYGLYMPEFFISCIVTPDDDPNYKRMKEQYAEQYLLIRQEQIKKSEAEMAQARKAVEAQTDANIKIIGAKGDAEALKIKKAAEAEAYRMKAIAEAEEMKMKGFTYHQQTTREVGLEAMKNGITGGEGGSSIGDIASLGVTLGAIGGVMGITKDVMSPMFESVEHKDSNKIIAQETWDCTCGNKGILTNFCPNCGNKKSIIYDSWNCNKCGTINITSNFCPNCGNKRGVIKESWSCDNCGTNGITSNFCPNCGKKRPTSDETWDCTCGQKNIVTKFCPNCGRER